MPAAVETAIAEHARREQPRECCGLLLGTSSAVVDAIPTRNMAERPTVRYTIDPTEHLAAIRLGRARALEVIGAYHSHVRSPAAPSQTDRAEAFPGFLFLIVSLAGVEPDFKAWRLDAGNFVAVSLVRST